MLEIGPNLKQTLLSSVHQLAMLWDIDRSDGTVLRFTNHNERLVFDGNTYSPDKGFDGSAVQLKSTLSARNLTFEGMISADVITEEDLRAGRYRDAKVTQYLINSRAPWLGWLDRQFFWIKDTTWTGETWEARLEGIGTWLTQAKGFVHTRTCRHNVGDAGCQVDLAPLTVAGEVLSITQPFLRFTSDLAEADGYFSEGVITWTSGLNVDTTSPVRFSQLTDGATGLHLETPFQIQVGDTFAVYPGCAKTESACKGTSGTSGRPWANNIVNYGGFPTIPGNDAALTTPDFK